MFHHEVGHAIVLVASDDLKTQELENLPQTNNQAQLQTKQISVLEWDAKPKQTPEIVWPTVLTSSNSVCMFIFLFSGSHLLQFAVREVSILDMTMHARLKPEWVIPQKKSASHFFRTS